MAALVDRSINCWSIATDAISRALGRVPYHAPARGSGSVSAVVAYYAPDSVSSHPDGATDPDDASIMVLDQIRRPFRRSRRSVKCPPAKSTFTYQSQKWIEYTDNILQTRNFSSDFSNIEISINLFNCPKKNLDSDTDNRWILNDRKKRSKDVGLLLFN